MSLNSTHCLMLSKVSLLTPGCGKEKYRAPSKENRQLVLKRIKKFPDGFQARVFKGNLESESCRVHDQVVNIFLIGWG